ncbi:MAG: folate-binding protein YgfZ [Candidatus Methylomirabilales bacterium]
MTVRPLSGELGEAAHEESPFAGRQRAAGGVAEVHFGVMLPEHFGDARAEYEAVRRAAGLIDLSFRGLLALGGSERLRWLNAQVTNEVASLRPGDGRLAAVLEVKGHVLADVAVFGREDSVWLDLPRNRGLPVQQALDRRIVADDVTIQNLTPQVARLLVAGPAAAGIVAELGAREVAGLAAWQHRPARLAEAEATIAAAPWLRQPGLAVTVPLEAAEGVWDALLEAGRPRGLRPVGMRALQWRRVEAGWPWYGLDLDETNLLMESLTPDYVSFTKGCYVGQEVVIRIEHQGHVNRKLTGLTLHEAVVPAAGAEVRAGGRAVGRVTSAVLSPALGRAIALAYVRREHLAPGTRLVVAAEPRAIEAEVTPLPFVP